MKEATANGNIQMRIIGYLALTALLAFIAWPYYQVFRLDEALGRDDIRALEQLVDLPAIRRNYKHRLVGGLGSAFNPANVGGPLTWLQRNLQHLGDTALEQVISLQWVRDSLREATTQTTNRRPPYFVAAISFAFFESYDSFLIRLGELGQNATHVRMRLRGKTWRVTDLIR